MSGRDRNQSNDKLINIPIIILEEDIKSFRKIQLDRHSSLSKSRSVGSRIDEIVPLLEELAQDHFDDGVGKEARMRGRTLRAKVRVKKSTQVYIRKYMRDSDIKGDEFAWLTRYLFLESLKQS